MKRIALFIFFLCGFFLRAQVCFDPAVNFPSDSTPYFVVIADFNKDNIPDVATPNDHTNNVALMLGTGNGNFAQTVYFGAGAGPISGTAADFNKDGNPDLAIANAASNNVSVLLGNGSGSFAAQTTYTASGGPTGIAYADFDGDSNLDLVVSNYDASNISILLGDGAGAFAAPINYPASVNLNVGPNYVITTDLNNDSKADVVVANWDGSDLSVFLGNGNATFTTPASISCQLKPCAIVAADFNHDGKMDLAAPNYFSNSVSVLLGNGSGGFAPAQNYTVGSEPYGITSGDFNMDGITDLAANNESSNSVSVLPGNGNGTFGPAATFATGLYPEGVGSADFNQDGKSDLAVANYKSASVSIMLNTIFPAVTAHASMDTVCAGSSVTLTGSGVNTYTWSNGATNGVPYTVNATTTFTVVGSNAQGCTNRDTITVHALICTGTDPLSSVPLKIYPNPSSQQITVESSQGGMLQIEDLTGKIIFTQALSPGTAILDISRLEKGVYFVRLDSQSASVLRLCVN